jgi:hypothetical protein
MLQRALPIALVASLVMPLAAQVPAGMKMRVDRSTSAQDPDDNPELKVVTAGKGFRVTGGPAGVFWMPTNTATGNYTVRATFTLMQPSNHRNYYGLVFGGSDLEGAAQAYHYFMVAQDGSFMVKQQAGGKAPTIQGSTKHQAIRTPDAKGQSVNTLEVRVAGDTISFVVNDTVVHTMPKGGIKTDGLVGVRVNHVLDVQIEGFELRKA